MNGIEKMLINMSDSDKLIKYLDKLRDVRRPRVSTTIATTFPNKATAAVRLYLYEYKKESETLPK